MSHTPSRPRTTVKDFFAGVRLLGTGLRLWITDPKLMLFGAIPAFIVAAVYAVGITALVLNFDRLVGWAASFSADADPWVHDLVTILIGIAIFAIAGLLIVYTFVAVTLAVGDPFYEKIWQRVEERLGNAPTGEETGFWKTVGDSIGFLFATIGTSLLILVIGFIPLVGQIAGPVLGAMFGGWFLTLELAARPFEKRGLTARDRRAALGARRATSIGFGVAVWLVFLIPFGAVIVMPAAVAGATVLGRQALGIPGALSQKGQQPQS